MIESIDQYIVGRLQKIYFGDAPVTVYPYIPGREQGKTIFPCIGVVLHAIYQQPEDARPDCEVISTIGESVTVDVPPSMGGDPTATGTSAYTFKPYPTPVELLYEVTALATRVIDIRKILEGIYQAFPTGHSPTITGQRPILKITQSLDSDDFDEPLFRKIHLLTVSDLWLDRAEIDTYSSMQDITFGVESN